MKHSDSFREDSQEQVEKEENRRAAGFPSSSWILTIAVVLAFGQMASRQQHQENSDG